MVVQVPPRLLEQSMPGGGNGRGALHQCQPGHAVVALFIGKGKWHLMDYL